MRKVSVALLVVLALLLATTVGVLAVTNGQPDNGRHPYVGLLVFFEETEEGFVPLWRCSGSLIAPDVILTAGHCTDGADSARVWFDEGPIPYGTFDSNGDGTCTGDTGYPCTGEDASGTPYTNPDFCIGCGNGLPGFAIYDVGVVVLDEPVTGLGFAELPTAGLVDTLANKTNVDLVGYGVQEQIRGGGPPVWAGLRVRLYALTQLVSQNFVHSDLFLRLTANPGQGKGGTCFGDSGGPDLLSGTDIVLGVNSYVTNGNCAGVTYSQRVDLPEVLAWIESFIE